jgi:NADH:ubiquinone oxidoreductase subunit F (NADH-binding)
MCVRVLIGTMSIRLSKDNHDSCGKCTACVECKTIITVVLMIMSGMDPHMISGNLGCVFGYVLAGLC